ncbi:MAG: hypothetical protein WC812_00550 [Candidatus Pacearchaeota archaeon]|jgi:hypothetical protein
MTIELISRTEKIYTQLKLEGKITNLENAPDYLECMEKMNKAMEEVRRDFIYKSGHSEIEAEKCYVDAIA